MYVKICANTNLSDAQLAADLGADAVGFIFAPSKRRVTVEQVAAITRALPQHVARIGIFTNPDAAEIVRTARDAGLTGVQLNFPFDPGLIAELEDEFQGYVQLWQVIGVETQANDPAQAERELKQNIEAALANSRLSVVLLDTAKAGVSGGLGESFAWARVATILREAAAAHDKRIPATPGSGPSRPQVIVAGGLNAENVREAIRVLGPAGVDVVSGVEQSPGRKSEERLSAFMSAVRDAQDALLPLA